jgi:Tol biopolymer transport system component
VTFGPTLAGTHGIYRVPLDAGRSPDLLVAAKSYVSPLSWTPDGKSLLYVQRSQCSDIWVLPTAGPGTPRPFLQTSFNENDAQVATDGKWVAYSSDESGRDEVYVVPFPGPGGKSQISTEGGQSPQWSRNGRELFYSNLTNQVMALDVQTGPSFHARRPQPLFKLTPGGPVWQVTLDPQRFLVERVRERATTTTFVVITDWFEDLQRRLPNRR